MEPVDLMIQGQQQNPVDIHIGRNQEYSDTQDLLHTHFGTGIHLHLQDCCIFTINAVFTIVINDNLIMNKNKIHNITNHVNESLNCSQH